MYSNQLFTPSQQRGVFWLALIGFISLSLWQLSTQISPTPSIPPPAIGSQLVSFRTSTLDLNLADSAELTALPGIGPTLARRIIRYRYKRQGLDSVAQLSHIYGLRPEVLAEVSSHLYVDSLTLYAFKQKTTQIKNPTLPSNLYLNLNHATSHQLALLPGIGPVLSERIVRFRDAKGGFASIGDLKKVYGLPRATYARIKNHLYVQSPAEASTKQSTDTSKIEILDLNVASAEQLDAIPGIGPTLAKRIVAFRKRLGFFYTPNQLLQVYGLSKENYERMIPFLVATPPSTSLKKNLNLLSPYQLTRYPSIDSTLAANIIALKKRLGMLSEWTELNQAEGITSAALAELQIYTVLD